MARINHSMETYLEKLGVSPTILGRVNDFLRIYDYFLPNIVFSDIFITDLVNDDGVRSYGNLWMWNSEFIVECGNFLYSENYDSARIGAITRWEVTSQDYEPGQEYEKSRLTVQWQSEDGLSGNLSATGTNCKYLTKYLKEAIIPHHLPSSMASESQS